MITWRGWSAGQIDTVIFELVEDPAAVEQMMRAGQLDVASSRVLGQEQMASLVEDERLVLDVSAGSLNSVLYLNQRGRRRTIHLCARRLPIVFPTMK